MLDRVEVETRAYERAQAELDRMYDAAEQRRDRLDEEEAKVWDELHSGEHIADFATSPLSDSYLLACVALSVVLEKPYLASAAVADVRAQINDYVRDLAELRVSR